jgi:hypothetical protein
MYAKELVFPLRSAGTRQRRRRHHAAAGRRIVDGLIAVLVAHAIVGEGGDLAVVALQASK